MANTRAGNPVPSFGFGQGGADQGAGFGNLGKVIEQLNLPPVLLQPI